MQLKGKNLVHCFSSSSHLAFFLDQILSFPRTPLFTWQPKLFQIVPNLLLLFLDQVSTFQSSVCYMSPNFDTFWELVCQGRWRYGWLSGCKAWHKQLVATTHCCPASVTHAPTVYQLLKQTLGSAPSRWLVNCTGCSFNCCAPESYSGLNQVWLCRPSVIYPRLW